MGQQRCPLIWSPLLVGGADGRTPPCRPWFQARSPTALCSWYSFLKLQFLPFSSCSQHSDLLPCASSWSRGASPSWGLHWLAQPLQTSAKVVQSWILAEPQAHQWPSLCVTTRSQPSRSGCVDECSLPPNCSLPFSVSISTSWHN